MKPGAKKGKKNYVIGSDYSTTGTKAIAFDRNGNVTARSQQSIQFFHRSQIIRIIKEGSSESLKVAAVFINCIYFIQ